MALKPQICRCGNHEIASSEVLMFGKDVEQTSSDITVNEQLLAKTYKFNVHYLIDRDEWHLQQFDSPFETAKFCRSLTGARIYKIYHQVSVNINGNKEIAARQINTRICEQMAGDEAACHRHNSQTAYKLAAKVPFI